MQPTRQNDEMVWASALVNGRGSQRSHQFSVAPSRRIVEPIRCSPSGIRFLRPATEWQNPNVIGMVFARVDRSARKLILGLLGRSLFYEGSPFRSDAGSGKISVRWSIFFGADMVWIASRFRKGSEETDLNDTIQYALDLKTSCHNGINHTSTCHNATNTRLGSIGQLFAYGSACIGHIRPPSRFIQISAWPTPSALT